MATAVNPDCIQAVPTKSLNRKRREWSDVEIHFGVTGRSGTGKSSFINAIRGGGKTRTPKGENFRGVANTKVLLSHDSSKFSGISDDDKRAAAVGVIETTTKPSCYVMHHGNPNIHFWDLPGIGTPSISNDLKKYCEQVGLKSYDCYLVLASDRFTENDRRLANMIRSFDKPFFFVRTHIDVDIKAEKRKRCFNEDLTLRDVREDCLKNLDGLVAKNDVYLISNHHTSEWDFDRLTQNIFDIQFKRKCDNILSRFNSLSVG